MVLFKNADIITADADDFIIRGGHVAVEGASILSVSKELPDGPFERVIDCKNKVLIPGLYNMHTHIPMTLLRGWGEELPLERWLNERIFPAEATLTGEDCYWGALLGAAEMVAGGIVSFSDMYFFSEDIIRAAGESGMKASVSRALTCFDEENLDDGGRMEEALNLYKSYNNSFDGRIRVDFAMHAIYTSSRGYIEKFARKVAGIEAVVQYHISETQNEHEGCIARYGKTPAAVFYEAGAFALPGVAAHCVWLSDEDMDILAENNITVAHNPSSNLKLASGIADLPAMQKKGINLTLGTDGPASNNNLNMFEEMHLCALLQKGVRRDPTLVTAKETLLMATANGAKAQGRRECGKIKAGYRADLALLNFDQPHLTPNFDPLFNVIYSAQAADVVMTVSDGKVLYENGSFTTIDIEKVKHNVTRIARRIEKG